MIIFFLRRNNNIFQTSPKQKFGVARKIILCRQKEVHIARKSVSCQQKKLMLHKNSISCRQKENDAQKNILYSKELLNFSRTARHKYHPLKKNTCVNLK